ncbi:MAG: hypothetical protein JRF49_08270 [Deltaproteobacteria bacterium]|nr:hypothetical protein [Deltaproteobacteria bacterium]
MKYEKRFFLSEKAGMLDVKYSAMGRCVKLKIRNPKHPELNGINSFKMAK